MPMGEMIKLMITRLEWFETRQSTVNSKSGYHLCPLLQVPKDSRQSREGDQREAGREERPGQAEPAGTAGSGCLQSGESVWYFHFNLMF